MNPAKRLPKGEAGPKLGENCLLLKDTVSGKAVCAGVHHKSTCQNASIQGRGGRKRRLLWVLLKLLQRNGRGCGRFIKRSRFEQTISTTGNSRDVKKGKKKYLPKVQSQ